MGIRQVGDRLLRCRDTPILSFLAPIINARTTWSRRQLLQRSFTASAYYHGDPSHPAVHSADLNFSQKVQKNEDIMNILDDTFGRVSKSKRSSSSADLVKDSFQAELLRPEEESRTSRQGKIWNTMQLPGEKPGEINRPAATDFRAPFRPRNTATIRSRPSLGRSVDVGPTGVARALQVLAYQLRDNNVRNDQRRQRFHERPGLKRKRLKSERWRKRFMIAFKATLKKVNEMRSKGW